MFNDQAGYGVKDDTFGALEALKRAGEDVWFQIGDRDFATHLVRTELLRRGCTLTEATLELCRRFGIGARVLPMSDGIVRTRFATDQGDLSFQEVLVSGQPKPAGSIRDARPAHTEVLEALSDADLVVIGLER
jgi:LPPG:FO 2-phospho-L-lactate transferase